jgi:hypothetical protein
MVPSKLTGGVDGAGLLVFLGCTKIRVPIVTLTNKEIVCMILVYHRVLMYCGFDFDCQGSHCWGLLQPAPLGLILCCKVLVGGEAKDPKFARCTVPSTSLN